MFTTNSKSLVSNVVNKKIHYLVFVTLTKEKRSEVKFFVQISCDAHYLLPNSMILCTLHILEWCGANISHSQTNKCVMKSNNRTLPAMTISKTPPSVPFPSKYVITVPNYRNPQFISPDNVCKWIFQKFPKHFLLTFLVYILSQNPSWTYHNASFIIFKFQVRVYPPILFHDCKLLTLQVKYIFILLTDDVKPFCIVFPSGAIHT